MFAPRRKATLFSVGPDRWLVLAGAGLLVLGLVLRLLTDIGRSTAQGDKATRIADTLAASPGTLPATTAETLAATPSAPITPPTAASAPKPVTTPPVKAGATKATAPTKPVPVPAAGGPLATNGWGVQLGAFRQRENAELLQAKVQRLGYTTSVGGSGTLTRVRVVGLPDRTAAQQAADSISRALGTTGLVVAPGH